MLKDHVLRVANPVRRRVPTVGVRALVRVRAWLGVRSARRLAVARREMEHLVGGVDPGADLDDLARRYVAWGMRRGEYRWHPDLVADQRILGLEHLRDAQGRGRGVVVTFLHHAHFEGAFLALHRAGFDLDGIVHPLMIAGGGGNFMRQHTLVCSMGATLHSTEIGSAGIADLLRAGRIVCLAVDVAGRTPVTFLGRERRGSFGAARLATETNSPVVVMSAERDGDDVSIRLSEPLEPADFADPRALLADVLARHEPAVRDFPEAYDQPVKRWGSPDQPAPEDTP